MWTVEKEGKTLFGRKYYLYATCEENGDFYRLESMWETPIYAINIYKNGDMSVDNCLLNMVLFADADMKRITHKVLSVLRRDIELNIKKVDEIYWESNVDDE